MTRRASDPLFFSPKCGQCQPHSKHLSFTPLGFWGRLLELPFDTGQPENAGLFLIPGIDLTFEGFLFLSPPFCEGVAQRVTHPTHWPEYLAWTGHGQVTEKLLWLLLLIINPQENRRPRRPN